ncbi:MAG: CRISPR-associated endonuclease Cas2 [Armatimonadota bacterium]
MSRQYVVIAYDIVDDQRRGRLLAKLKALGWHKQFSLFECYTTPERLLLTKDAVAQIIAPEEDTVIYYHLCERCRRQIQRVGIDKGGIGGPDQDLIII